MNNLFLILKLTMLYWDKSIFSMDAMFVEFFAGGEGGGDGMLKKLNFHEKRIN